MQAAPNQLGFSVFVITANARQGTVSTVPQLPPD